MSSSALPPPQRIVPSWSIGLQLLDPEDGHSYRLQVLNEGAMVGTFTPLALQSNANPDREFTRLKLRALPGSDSSSLVNPGDSLFFELIAEPGRPLPAGESIVLELFYAAISPQTGDWYSLDRDAAVLSLPIVLGSTADREDR